MTHGQNKIPTHPGLGQLEPMGLPAGAGSPPGALPCHFPGTLGLGWGIWVCPDNAAPQSMGANELSGLVLVWLLLLLFFPIRKGHPGAIPQGKESLCLQQVLFCSQAALCSMPKYSCDAGLYWSGDKGLRVLLNEVWMIKLCWYSCSCIIEHKLQLVWFCS